jgi:hypothetical protein
LDNDYGLFVINSSLTAALAASTERKTATI